MVCARALDDAVVTEQTTDGQGIEPHYLAWRCGVGDAGDVEYICTAGVS